MLTFFRVVLLVFGVAFMAQAWADREWPGAVWSAAFLIAYEMIPWS